MSAKEMQENNNNINDTENNENKLHEMTPAQAQALWDALPEPYKKYYRFA